MGFLSTLFTSHETIVSSRIVFDKILVHGEINVGHRCENDGLYDYAMHMLVLCQISKMLYVVPKNYKFTEHFIAKYYEVCDKKYNSYDKRFKDALFNESLKNQQYDAPSYIFYKPENEIEIYQSKVRFGLNKTFNFKTNIPILGNKTGTALSTPLVFLEIINQTGNNKLLDSIQNSVRLMCGKYLNGFKWNDFKNMMELPHIIYDMNHK